MAASASSQQAGTIFQRLSIIDRFLPAWIFLAMAIGVILRKIFPDVQDTFDSLQIDTLISMGLIPRCLRRISCTKSDPVG